MSPNPVYCIAASHQQAERIFDQLTAAQFPARHISMLYPDFDTAHDSAHVLVAVSTGNTAEVSRAKAIFLAAGAGDICTSGAAARPDTLEQNAPEHTAPLPAEPSSVRYHCPA